MTARELKLIRERLGWSQARLAKEVAVSPNSIARQERGEMGIRESLARLIQLVAEHHESTRTAHRLRQIEDCQAAVLRRLQTSGGRFAYPPLLQMQIEQRGGGDRVCCVRIIQHPQRSEACS